MSVSDVGVRYEEGELRVVSTDCESERRIDSKEQEDA